MSIESHIKSLISKRNEINDKIHKAHTHYLPTVELKKEKLKINDQILWLENLNKTKLAA